MKAILKYLVSIEFRYTVPTKEGDDEYTLHYGNKIITIGVYDNIITAIDNGNKVLEILEYSFKLNPHYNVRRRFSKKDTLISNLAYLETPFEFYAKITPLEYDDVSSIIADVMNQIKGN